MTQPITVCGRFCRPEPPKHARTTSPDALAVIFHTPQLLRRRAARRRLLNGRSLARIATIGRIYARICGSNRLCCRGQLNSRGSPQTGASSANPGLRCFFAALFSFGAILLTLFIRPPSLAQSLLLDGQALANGFAKKRLLSIFEIAVGSEVPLLVGS